MSCEVWRSVEGFENVMQVSSQGRVRVAEERYVSEFISTDLSEESVEVMKLVTVYRLLDQKFLTKEYLGVNYNKQSFFVHQLVADAFIPNPENKKLIIHKDTDKQNNFADNLIRMTNSERAKQSMKNGTMLKPPGYSGYRIVCKETGEVMYGLRKTAKFLGVNVKTLEDALLYNRSINGKHYSSDYSM